MPERTECPVRAPKTNRRLKPARNKKKPWSANEEAMLEEKWGLVSVPQLSKILGRSKDAIRVRAFRLGLGRHIESGYRISVNQLFQRISMRNYRKDVVDLWIANGFPVKYHRVNKNRFRVVDLDEFWEWAEQHKDLINLKHMEPLALGKEPDWVKVKRNADKDLAKRTHLNNNQPWTKWEDLKLERMLVSGKYTLKEIASELRKTEGAVNRRSYDLAINDLRPKRAPNRMWTKEEERTLLEMRNAGHSYEQIADRLGRSASAVHGKYERILNPEYMKRYIRGKSKEYKYNGVHSMTTAELLREWEGGEKHVMPEKYEQVQSL